jgi:hypothetical protein
VKKEHERERRERIRRGRKVKRLNNKYKRRAQGGNDEAGNREKQGHEQTINNVELGAETKKKKPLRLTGVNSEFINKKCNSYTVPVTLGLKLSN